MDPEHRCHISTPICPKTCQYCRYIAMPGSLFTHLPILSIAMSVPSFWILLASYGSCRLEHHHQPAASLPTLYEFHHHCLSCFCVLKQRFSLNKRNRIVSFPSRKQQDKMITAPDYFKSNGVKTKWNVCLTSLWKVGLVSGTASNCQLIDIAWDGLGWQTLNVLHILLQSIRKLMVFGAAKTSLLSSNVAC